MEKTYYNERWKHVDLGDQVDSVFDIEVSDYGRVRRTYADGRLKLMKFSQIEGYYTINLRKPDGKSTSRYVHRLVAEAFSNKLSDHHRYVLHLDYDKLSNSATNLKWATKREKELHQQENPNWRSSIGKVTHAKLDETKVKLIKKRIFDPNRKTRLKIIAKQFGISEMQLNRIKRGENWGHVTID